MRADRRRVPQARELAVDAVEHVGELDERRPRERAQRGSNASTAAPATNTGSDANVTWLGVIRGGASGTSTTAASGRATKRFHSMSFGFRVRR